MDEEEIGTKENFFILDREVENAFCIQIVLLL